MELVVLGALEVDRDGRHAHDRVANVDEVRRVLLLRLARSARERYATCRIEWSAKKGDKTEGRLLTGNTQIAVHPGGLQNYVSICTSQRRETYAPTIRRRTSQRQSERTRLSPASRPA